MTDKIEKIEVEAITQEQNVPAVISNPMNLIELAVSKGADVSQLEKLMDLYERWNKEQARKLFIKAMSEFQAECPRVKRTKDGAKTNSGITAYKYPPLEEIAETIQPFIGKYGFSYTFTTPEISKEGVQVELKIAHIGGHVEITKTFMPWIERTGVMSPPQVVGATSTYAKRYALVDGFGITSADEDTDAITDSLVNELDKVIENWQYKESYISPLLETVKKKSVLRKILNDLPTEEQTVKFIEAVNKLKPELHRKFWAAFQKQTNKSADQFINEINNNLTKEK